MRGCCHRPGVDTAGEGCCWGVRVLLEVCCNCGIELSLGSTAVEVPDGEGATALCCGWEGIRLVLEEDERTRAVVDIFRCAQQCLVFPRSQARQKLLYYAAIVSKLVTPSGESAVLFNPPPLALLFAKYSCQQAELNELKQIHA